jgi:hypothetical protein
MTRAAYLELIGKHARKNEEEQLQRAIVEHLRLRHKPGVIFFHCPNGEARSKATGGRLKAMGVRAGVFDLILMLPGPVTFLLELKAGSNKMSPAQEQFAKDLNEIGIGWACAWSIDDALAVLEGIGAITPEAL